MDAVSVVFYGAVCGLLALIAPLFRSLVARLAAGIAIGVIAAAALPLVRALMAG